MEIHNRCFLFLGKVTTLWTRLNATFRFLSRIISVIGCYIYAYIVFGVKSALTRERLRCHAVTSVASSSSSSSSSSAWVAHLRRLCSRGTGSARGCPCRRRSWEQTWWSQDGRSRLHVPPSRRRPRPACPRSATSLSSNRQSLNTSYLVGPAASPPAPVSNGVQSWMRWAALTRPLKSNAALAG